MLTNEILSILQKYQEDNFEIVTEINDSINDIVHNLKNLKDYLAKEITLLATDDNPNNKIEEIAHDSNILKKYISTIKFIPENEYISSLNEYVLPVGQLSINDIIEKIHVFVIDDNICPKCGVHLEDCQINYKQRISSKSVMWHKCPACNRLFVFDYEIEHFENSDTNIILDYKYSTQKEITFNDVIVLSNIASCTTKDHGLIDVTARIPVFLDDGNIGFVDINTSYCPKCNKYIMLKTDFKQIEGVIACKVVDYTTIQNGNNNYYDDEIEIKQKESILYQYGYNVKTKEDLSDKQRHIILASVVESQILTREQICLHLDTLIERGSKIEKWEPATQKWKQDRQYVKKYNNKNLPTILFDKVILKYNVNK